jgi:hypothetical protein
MASARSRRGSATRALHGLLSCAEMTWLPEAFAHPERVDLATGHFLRPLREADERSAGMIVER